MGQLLTCGQRAAHSRIRAYEAQSDFCFVVVRKSRRFRKKKVKSGFSFFNCKLCKLRLVLAPDTSKTGYIEYVAQWACFEIAPDFCLKLFPIFEF